MNSNYKSCNCNCHPTVQAYYPPPPAPPPPPQLVKLQQLGSGTFGTVHLCLEKVSNAKFAVKEIHRSRLKKAYMDPQKEGQLMEVTVMQSMNFPNLVQYHGHFERDDHVYIVMEFTDGIPMIDYIKAKKLPTEQMSSFIFKQMLFGVAYMHVVGFAHLDIKPANIMICRSGLVKLFDFGTSLRIMSTMSKKRGTIRFLPPEALVENPSFRPAPCDVWALGCTLFQFFTGKKPFKNDEETITKYFVLKRKVTSECHRVIYSALKKKPDQRVTSWDLLSYKWLEDAYIPTQEEWAKYIVLDQQLPSS